MSLQINDKKIVAEQIFELRHDASGAFLDARGAIADFVRENKLFPHWKIDPNIVNFYDIPTKIDKEGASIGYKSINYIVFNPETTNYFQDKASSFFKKILRNINYKIPENLTRFGLRTRVYFPSEKQFETIREMVFDTFYLKSVRDLIGGKEKDIFFVFDIVDGEFDVKIAGGPGRGGEISAYFSFPNDDLNKTGIYLDIDLSKTKNLKLDSIQRLIHDSNELVWAKVKKFHLTLGI